MTAHHAPRSSTRTADGPTGTVTLIFTDIEGSTRLLQHVGGERYARLLGEHHRILRDAIARFGGTEVKTEGDSFFATFPRAAHAVGAAVVAQRELAGHDWPDDGRIRVRMGIHTGDIGQVEGEYVGLDIHRGARIANAAHGGQVLVSAATSALVASGLPPGVSIRDLGEHRLKDIDDPEQLLQLVIDGLPADFPPLRALSTRFDLLPPEMSSFVGRERVLEQAHELMDETRLLTLTGPGGTGKTRLSLRLARSVSHEFADGVAFVPLAPITDPELVAPTIRHTLGLTEQPGRTALETLSERLAGREVLLLLDNFEQVTAAASVVGQLLEATEGLKIIVTSRAALHLTGEQEYPVPPLALPAAADATDLEMLSQSEAVALFVQRARAVRPDFAVTADNALAIVEICSRLDGLPLAIELAASRIKLLPPQALLSRLEKSLDVLQSSAADRTDRQRTLRGAIDWSYGLLSADEQALFRRLSIFVGGWTLDAAEQIVPAAGHVALDPLDGLTSLVNHSLVRQDEIDGEPRFSLLETIREYAGEQLAAAAELAPTAAAHAAWFAELVEKAEEGLTSGAEWPDRIEREHANIRAAIAWLADSDMDQALLAGGRLWRFWHLRGHLREGAALLSDLLGRPPAQLATAARAKALIGLAGLVYWQVNYERARGAYEEALAIAHAIGDRRLEVEARYSLAYVRIIEGDWDGAIRDFRAARALFEDQGAELMVAWADLGIGMTATLRGDHAAALPLLAESRRRAEVVGDGFALRNVIAVEGRALMQLGRLDEAGDRNRQVLQLAQSTRDVTALSAGLLDAATLAALGGSFERAGRLIGAAERIVEESGGQPPPELINRIDPLPLVQQALEPGELERLVAEGRRLPTDEAVAEALAEDT